MREIFEAAIPDWYAGALCAQIGGDDFYPEVGANGTMLAMVRAVCAQCPVHAQCLEYALDNTEAFGIWGGTTPMERRKLRIKGAA